MLRGYNVTLRRLITQEYQCQIVIDDDTDDIASAVNNVWDNESSICWEEIDWNDDDDYTVMTDEEFNNKGDMTKEWYNGDGSEIDIADYIKELLEEELGGKK